MTADPSDFTSALPDGPWRHELVPANGARFHVAVAGPHDRGVRDPGPPLVVLLHSFPQFWWAWRHQVEPLAAAGYRVAALDVRGVGASDKPPLGYDAPTRTRDIAGVIRSLGAGRAVVVGHGTGGSLAWAMAALQPAVTAGVAALAAPHPARMHVSARQLLTPVARRHLAFFQVPTFPERALLSGRLVDQVLTDGAATPFDDDVAATYRTVMRIPFAAHTAMESLRWAVRSTPRPDGRRFLSALRRPVTVPALQVHGGRDGLLRRALADADGAALASDYRFEVLPDAGHFLPEEAPDEVTDLLLDWLGRISSS
ncbi:alpha/beta fold hydrolase [Cellulosimicrobium marinum]|uniref:alpha/beta fold hydrolase n=1 Tax=Cellulosimicrobium marinum TaxID=1638992 RepID=UPI001E5ADFCD|nr:alpha/beta hydrolase [Cellulosimicrobium marinum]MCB7136287.1 alpha/beta hydrolase [Cellulosimicrobium marinum]